MKLLTLCRTGLLSLSLVTLGIAAPTVLAEDPPMDDTDTGDTSSDPDPDTEAAIAEAQAMFDNFPWDEIFNPEVLPVDDDLLEALVDIFDDPDAFVDEVLELMDPDNFPVGAPARVSRVPTQVAGIAVVLATSFALVTASAASSLALACDLTQTNDPVVCSQDPSHVAQNKAEIYDQAMEAYLYWTDIEMTRALTQEEALDLQAAIDIMDMLEGN